MSEAGALTAREAGDLTARVAFLERQREEDRRAAEDRHDELLGRLRTIDDRLKAGDRRFRAAEIDKVRFETASTIVLWIGRGVIAALFSAVVWAMSHAVPALTALLWPPKH